jgi:uncharacterized NAD(P)/FAD-binding protein YdhS
MVVTRAPRVRIVGAGTRLRLRPLGDWDSNPVDALRECCRAQTALAKAMWQTVRQARDAGHSWTEIGDALGVTKQTAWQRFSGDMRHPITGEEIEREDKTDR